MLVLYHFFELYFEFQYMGLIWLSGTICSPMSDHLIGAGVFLRRGGALPEEKIQKDDHLRPRRLRRSTAVRNITSSGGHSLAGTELSGTVVLR